MQKLTCKESCVFAYVNQQNGLQDVQYYNISYNTIHTERLSINFIETPS